MMTTLILDGVKYLKLSLFRKLDRILNLTIGSIVSSHPPLGHLVVYFAKEEIIWKERETSFMFY